MMADVTEFPIQTERLDNLPATILPNRDHVLPAMREGVSVKLSAAQILSLLIRTDLAGKLFAEDVAFDPGTAGLLSAETVQAALEELAFNAPLPGYLFGLTLSNATDTEHDITVASGRAASDDADPAIMVLSSAITKQLDATFVEGTGNGGMVSGESLPTSGTIHVWLIMKADGTVDVCANNNASSSLSPTLPTGFVHKRRIGSLRTNGSANIYNFRQRGDDFTYTEYKGDVTGASQASSPTLRNITVPEGIKVIAKMNFIARGTQEGFAIVYDPDLGTIGAGGITNDLYFVASAVYNSTFLQKTTNASGQVATSNNATSGGIVTISTWGYIDSRGRDA